MTFFLAAIISAAISLVPYPNFLKEEKGCCGRELLSSARLVEKASLAPEEYEIRIRPNGVTVKASSPAGFFYASRTLEQLSLIGDKIPCMRIKDKPRFAYRGVLLDCARHYYSVDEIKKFIDILAFHKVNRFHWHLTDDHAWRLEIRRYPRLVEVGAFGNVGSRADFDPKAPFDVKYEGYYSQEQVREIVKYAQDRFITIVPEIDMPGHMTAALAAYPFLGCTGGPYQVVTAVKPRGMGLAKDSLCPGRESTFEFLQNVLLEVMELFPGEYVHVGGDECIKEKWQECPECRALVDSLGLVAKEGCTEWEQLEVWMINRVASFLSAHGRKAIGWDETLNGDLGENITVMSWRGVETGINAAKRGYDVIMAPVEHCYLDYRQTRNPQEPEAFAGTVTLDDVYSYDPTMELNSAEASHVIGAQGNVWCNVMGSMQLVEYHLLPRLAALSEVQWCRSECKDYERFKKSMDTIRNYYDAHGYEYHRGLWDVIGFPPKD